MFVVLHHIWLTSWPSFPHTTGPWWLAWLLYGHMAVAVFIVVSGFSLALVPMRNGGELAGGVSRFLHRRAWRIIPAYWAALVLSILVTAILLHPGLGPDAIGKSLAVHGLLVQDVVGSQTPNGAFWSIAIEWQIYFVFPLILLLARRSTITIAVAITAGVVLLAHAIAGLGGPLDKISGFTPQFLALFALGALAVWLGGGDHAQRLRRPLAAVSLLTIGAFVALAVTHGSEWVVREFFWMDLLFGIGIASGLALLFAGGLVPLRRVLASRLALWLGLFSYSIYLIHDPVVGILDKYAFGPLHLSPLGTFALTLVLGLPVILAVCYGFHVLFEAPFLRHRGLSALKTMPIVRPLMRRAASPTTGTTAASESAA
jgi:peptidoglycan/LPS O-acetylase OafA/YrhL